MPIVDYHHYNWSIVMPHVDVVNTDSPKGQKRLFDVQQPTASRAINELVDEGVLEEVTGKGRNEEYRAREIFEVLEQPPQTD